MLHTLHSVLFVTVLSRSREFCCGLTIEPDNPKCNPLSKARGSRTMMVILGAMFTFLAIAYSTTRAATQGSSIGKNQTGAIFLDTEQGEDHNLVTSEPSERRRMRAEALQAAVDAGYIFQFPLKVL